MTGHRRGHTVPRMRSRTVLAASLAVAAGAAPSADAATRPASGWYGGKAAGAVIGFRVGGGAARELRTGSLPARCADGIARTVRVPVLGGWRASVRTGRPRATVRITDPMVAGQSGTATFRAVFTSRRRASGSIRVRVDHPTGTTCDTGPVRFAVARRAAEPVAPLPARWFAGRTADGSLLELAMSPDGTGLRPSRMRQEMACQPGGSVTLDITWPQGQQMTVAPGGTFASLYRFTPPAITGRPAPSGGAIEVSGRDTATGLDGAARMTIGFTDGSWCDGGWTRFTFRGITAPTVG